MLVGPFFELPGATFALGGTILCSPFPLSPLTRDRNPPATSYKFLKEVPIMAKFTTTQQLVGYDHKWVRSSRHLVLVRSADQQTGGGENTSISCTRSKRSRLLSGRSTARSCRTLCSR